MLNVILYDDFVIDYNDLKSSLLETQLSVDCHMKITINEKIFYNDWICPIEFYYQYCKWKNNCKESNDYSDFEYVTEDNGVNPILKFQYIGNNNWRIDSCYKEYDEANIFTTEQIKFFFDQYEIQLFEHVKS